MSKVYMAHENFPAAKQLLKIRKITNGKANFDVLWCDFPDCKQVLLFEEIFSHPVKPVQFSEITLKRGY